MKKTLRCFVLLVLAGMIGTGLAIAGDPSPALSPQPAAICPLIGCVDGESCRRDRDCTAAPGGVCNLFCPTRGCCAYPSP